MQLKIKNFSCIKDADLSLGPLTVLIGPQASGKSVITKLAYFFVDRLLAQGDSVSSDQAFEQYLAETAEAFSEWFPPRAWGKARFVIIFALGPLSLKISPKVTRGMPTDRLQVRASEGLRACYAEIQRVAAEVRRSEEKGDDLDFIDYEMGWRIRTAARDIVARAAGVGRLRFQTFIPAGRSFFTTMGKAFMVFDQSRALDPVTIRFGRVFSSLTEGFRLHRHGHDLEPEFIALLGGRLVREKDRQVLVAADGRSIPLATLSSGQQELLPLAVVLSQFTDPLLKRRHTTSKQAETHWLYIEEPEAHLFPEAQSQVVEAMARLVSGDHGIGKLVVTTHSPYVLAKLNNLALAGIIEKTIPLGRRKSFDELMPKSIRLKSGSLTAYAIVNGVLQNVMGQDGLIDGDYLDSVSGSIAAEFESLLEFQFGAAQ